MEQAAQGHEAAPAIEGAVVRAPYISVASEDGIDRPHQHAIGVGATALHVPGNTQSGNHRCEPLDPEGHQWSFGTYVPGPTW